MRLLGTAELNTLLHFICTNDTWFVDEMRDALEIVYPHKTFSLTTIWRGLSQLGISRKLVTIRAREAIEAQAIAFLGRIVAIRDWRVYVWFDESAANQKTPMRRYGYSPVGKRTRSKCIFVKGVRYTLILAMAATGVLTWRIQKGGAKGPDVHDFVRDLLPYLNPYPEPRSVVVADNCGTHKDPEIIALVENIGARWCNLPPYCPWLNPVEKAFRCVKSWLRRNQDLVGQLDPYVALDTACKSISSGKAMSWMEECSELYMMG